MHHLLAAFALATLVSLPAFAQAPAKPLNVVVLTGGHDFDQKVFPKLFEGHDGLSFTIVALKDHSEIFEDISGFKFDVIVFYNMTQKISEKRRANFLALLDRGVGLVPLHHVICAYQEWPEFNRIIGARYFQKAEMFEGKEHAKSTYKHDLDMPIRVVEPSHPITRGLKDFTLRDEGYKSQWFDPQAKLLLSTSHADSDAPIAWCKTYAKSRVCTIQLGHGPEAYTDLNYRQLLAQAIRWTAER